jgi:AraC-like DNA-binding protein
MVCPRCILAVEQVLNKLGIAPLSVRLGEVVLREPMDAALMKSFEQQISAIGFELLDNSRHQIIDRIKTIVIENIHFSDGANAKENFSGIIARELHRDYSFLSNLFSEVEGKTIEKFIIQQKIEKVKELIVYDELNLNEIAEKLGYSSVAYLSGQFKKITGLTPTQFKQLGSNRDRKSLDSI